MKRIRITLAGLMAVVAVFAVELAALAFAWRHDESELTRGLAPTGLACEFGLLCAVLSRGRSRAFWTGFVVSGCAMMSTFAWAMCFRESAANEAWASYVESAEGVMSTTPPPLWLFDGGGLLDGGDGGMAQVFALPQLAAACAGGVFALLVTLIPRRFFGVRALDSAPVLQGVASGCSKGAEQPMPK